MYGDCFEYQWNGVQVAVDGTYAIYFQFVPSFPAKVIVVLNSTIFPSGVSFGRDQDASLGTDAFADGYYAAQMILSIPANTFVQFYLYGLVHTQLASQPASVTMIRLSPELTLLPPPILPVP